MLIFTVLSFLSRTGFNLFLEGFDAAMIDEFKL